MSHRRDVATDVREMFSKSRKTGHSRWRLIEIKTLYIRLILVRGGEFCKMLFSSFYCLKLPGVMKVQFILTPKGTEKKTSHLYTIKTKCT